MAGDGTVRVLIADAVPLFRIGVHAVLREQLGFELVGEATEADEALALVAEKRPDLVLLDAALPPSGCLAVLGRLAVAAAPPLTLVLSRVDGPEPLEEALEAGARGVLRRSVSADMLVKAIRSVAAGEYWLERGQASEIVSRVRARAVGLAPALPRDDGLTRRERAIVECVAAGQSNREVATRLGIAEDTVKHHLSDVFDKLGVANRTELAAWATRRGLSSK